MKFRGCMNSLVLDRLWDRAETMTTADLVCLYDALIQPGFREERYNTKLYTERFHTRQAVVSVLTMRKDTDEAAEAWVTWYEREA